MTSTDPKMKRAILFYMMGKWKRNIHRLGLTIEKAVCAKW